MGLGGAYMGNCGHSTLLSVIVLFSHFRCAKVTCAGSVRVTFSRTLEQILVCHMNMTAHC